MPSVVVPEPAATVSGKDVEKVVTTKLASVRTSCQPKTCVSGTPVRVRVTISIDADGNVVDSSSHGDRVVGACIE
ncbi:MAG: hypothetical protein ACXWP4_15960, partial [Polyangiales bacterium]